MDPQSNCLFITYVEKEGPFLKVWGQTDKNTSLYIEQVLHGFTAQFDNGLCIPHPETLQIGILCCAKYKDNKYYRSRITSLDFLHNRYIEVNFVDYGHKDVVPISNIRSLEGFETSFISIQPQAASFLLAEAVCPRGEWNDAYLDEICKEIRYSEVNFSIIAQVTKHYLVRLFVGVNDLAIILISKGLMRHTSLTTQEAVLLSMMPRTSAQLQQGAPQQSIATYKAFTLEPGSQYEVYVSYVTDGPCNFSVQLKQSEEVLGKLMKEINSMTLTPIEGIPIPGTVCLARCMEDGHICRAVVTNEVDGQFKVFYVDFGNFEVIPLEALYEIPFKYVIPKVMAIRFALAGVEKSTVTLDMQCAFKQFVDNRLIHMKVMPMTTRTSLPRCELWDPETQVNALDIVNQAASAGYPDHITLNRGFSQPVKVSYVFSCNRFYIQLKSRQDELMRLMLDIQALCRDPNSISNNMIKVGLPCYALYEGDQQWYRSQIIQVLGGGQAQVRYVDYGNEEVVSLSQLKPIEGRQLTILRPQAIECCLNGYQNMEVDVERDNLLEELILEQEFTMKVVEMQGKKALIELIDSANYNVASLLLDKIASTRSQVSPMLVQAGNKIEHRKSFQQQNSKEQLFKQDQKPQDRGEKQWDSTNENSGWRNEDRGSRNRSFESNEPNENNSWRQNNKGFNKNYDRNKRDNDVNDSTDSERHNIKGYSRNDRNRNDSNTRNTEGGWKENRGFNKNQDRFNKDNNRNNDWSGANDRSPKGKDDWGGNKDKDRQNFNAKGNDDWNENKPNTNSVENDVWGDSKETETKQFNKRDKDNWSGGGGKHYLRNKEDWNSGKEGDNRQFNKRDNDKWANKEGDKRNFNSKENDWGGKREDSWGGKENDRASVNSKEDDWGGTGGRRDKDGWGNKGDRKDRPNFNNRNRFDDGNDESTHKGGFRKKPEFRRETSELSSSGSEKSFRKGFKDNNFRNKDRPFNKKFDKPKSFRNDASGGDGTWNVGASTTTEVPNAAPSTAKFTLLTVDNTESNVIISWFHNPASFYCQIENTQDQFKRMMEEIQVAYKGRRSSTASVGSPVIGLFPEDNVLYRAEVLETVGSQFKVYYVDFGNVSLISKVWPIETRFMELPAQAVCCKLSGIEPPGENWPDSNSYGSYFDKKQFFCRFLSTENDKVAVNLEYESEDIGSSLVRDGLALASVVPAPPELPLLIGQQFRAMLFSVNSLGDFYVALHSGVLLSCSIFNLSQSTETWEDSLKEKLEQILIVYVDDLNEERLEVTLYDQCGAKIKLIDKDEEAFETVDTTCPYLIQYSVISGEVSHVEENTVFLQPFDCAESLEYLLNTMYQYYENTPAENPVSPVEGFVYAVRGSDTNWYRGRATKVAEDQVTVNYFDYGNSEEVEVSALRDLTADFMDMSIMCLAVTVKDVTEDLIGKNVTVKLTFTEAGLEGTIEEEQTLPLPVEEAQVPLIEPQINETQPQIHETEPQIHETEPRIEETESPVHTSAAIGIQVVLSHTDSPSDFYLQLAESIESTEQLQATLQEQIPEMVDMENPVVGVLCAAPYSLDQQWYRAQVLDGDDDITTVRFVDYGNTDVLDNHTTRVKTLPTNLLSMEVHATRCTLKMKPTDEEWTSAASERFEQLCSVDCLTAQFISQDEKTNYVELYSNGTSVREVLIQENLALPDEVTTETSTIGFMSHLNSPSEFWIQLENCVDELEWVAEQLSGSDRFPELEDLAPGTLCAALFPDDQMWYRARILSNTVAGIEVLFVDYGNSCTSCSLRELPEDLVMLPPLAQKCSLQKPENLTNWGPEMVRKFSEISADGQTTFNVKKLSTGETASVELLLDGIDVTTLLLPKTEDVRVKSFEGFDKIVLIKDEQELTEYKLETLPEVVWNEESVKKFEELNDDGKTVFQAEFVSDDTVRLYLGLNDIRLELNGTKTTTPTSSPLKTRSDKTGDIAHSDENATGDYYTMKTMVEGLVESFIDHQEHKDFAEGLVAEVFDSVTNPSQTINSVQEVECLVEGLVDSVVDHQEHKDFAEGIVVEMVDSVTNHSQTINRVQEVECLVEGLVDSIIDHQENKNFVESVVDNMIDSVTKQSRNSETELSSGADEKFGEGLVDRHEHKDFAEGLVVEMVDSVTNQSRVQDVECLVEGLVDPIIDHHENKNFVDSVVDDLLDIVTYYSRNTETKSTITNIDIYEAATDHDADSNSIAVSVLTEIIQHTTKDITKFITPDISTQNNQNEALGGGTNLLNDESQDRTELSVVEFVVGTNLELNGKSFEDVVEESPTEDLQSSFDSDTTASTNQNEMGESFTTELFFDITQQTDQVENDNVDFFIESSTLDIIIDTEEAEETHTGEEPVSNLDSGIAEPEKSESQNTQVAEAVTVEERSDSPEALMKPEIRETNIHHAKDETNENDKDLSDTKISVESSEKLEPSPSESSEHQNKDVSDAISEDTLKCEEAADSPKKLESVLSETSEQKNGDAGSPNDLRDAPKIEKEIADSAKVKEVTVNPTKISQGNDNLSFTEDEDSTEKVKENSAEVKVSSEKDKSAEKGDAPHTSD